MQSQVQSERQRTPSAEFLRIVALTNEAPKVSYAQNLEDVLLFRALGSIKNGFYIDAGANDPVTHSVTKMFYDLGWRGINIEPSAQWFERLSSERERDINLNIAVSDNDGEMTFFELPDTGLSTSTARFAENAESQGFQKVQSVVKTDTLSNICDRYAPSDIHFLKIDVEGDEAAALRGADFSRHRPWIVVVEATEPMSATLSHREWEPILTQSGYEFVIFDNLNRFYVAREHSSLKPFFSAPADRYTRSAPPNALPATIEVLPESIGWRQIASYAIKRIRNYAGR